MEQPTDGSDVAFLSSTDLDESLVKFQSIAANSVQRLAAAFAAAGSAFDTQIKAHSQSTKEWQTKIHALTIATMENQQKLDRLTRQMFDSEKKIMSQVSELLESYQRDENFMTNIMNRLGSLEDRLTPVENRLSKLGSSRLEILEQRISEFEALFMPDAKKNETTSQTSQLWQRMLGESQSNPPSNHDPFNVAHMMTGPSDGMEGYDEVLLDAEDREKGEKRASDKGAIGRPIPEAPSNPPVATGVRPVSRQVSRADSRATNSQNNSNNNIAGNNSATTGAAGITSNTTEVSLNLNPDASLPSASDKDAGTGSRPQTRISSDVPPRTTPGDNAGGPGGQGFWFPNPYYPRMQMPNPMMQQYTMAQFAELAAAAANNGGNAEKGNDFSSKLGKAPVAGETGGQALRRFYEQLREQSRAIGSLEDAMGRTIERLTELARNYARLRDNQESLVRRCDTTDNAIMKKFEGVRQDIVSSHSTLDKKLAKNRREIDEVTGASCASITSLEKGMEQKADMRIVMEKVNRAEYLAQIKKLQQADDELAGRAVPREEYKSTLIQLKDSIKNDQEQRQLAIARLANEVHKISNEIGNKASKNDLLHISTVLNGMPKIHEEIENLKNFVNTEVAVKTEQMAQRMVDRQEVNRILSRKLQKLQEEVLEAAQPSDCDTCTKRSGPQAGTHCLSCAAPLKIYDKEFTATKGGGFSVVMPKSARSVEVKEEKAPKTKTTKPSAAVGSQSARQRFETGADGKVYPQPGSRTHRMIASQSSFPDLSSARSGDMSARASTPTQGDIPPSSSARPVMMDVVISDITGSGTLGNGGAEDRGGGRGRPRGNKNRQQDLV